MFGHWLENKIDKLESLFPIKDTRIRFGKFERNDWRPVWALSKEIQEDFRSVRDFPSPTERQNAWNRFCSLRSRASELADYDKEAFASQSKELRTELLYRLKGVGWTPFTEFMFFFDPTTVDEIKGMGAILHEVGQSLASYKAYMTAEHKSEVFERMKEKRAELDHFWEKRREAQEQRTKEFNRKREDFRSRVSENIEKNKERLRKAQAAADRSRDRISEIEGKIRDTDSAKWQSIFSGWLEEEQSKLSDIEDSIEQIIQWIAESKAKLN